MKSAPLLRVFCPFKTRNQSLIRIPCEKPHLKLYRSEQRRFTAFPKNALPRNRLLKEGSARGNRSPFPPRAASRFGESPCVTQRAVLPDTPTDAAS